MKISSIREEKGITLTVLIILVMILLLIAGTLVYNSGNGAEIKALKQMQQDVELLQNKVQLYYLDHKEIPTIAKYTKTNGIQNKNPNDEAQEYYVLDLGKLEGVHLNYGKEYEKIITNLQTADNYQNIYIINKKTHTIYYVKGIEVDEMRYYTTNEK